MIGARRDDATASDEVGFLDVAANALAVIVLATLFVILIASPPTRPGPDAARKATLEITFPDRPDPTERPLGRLFYVLPEGLVALDFDAYAKAAILSGDSAGVVSGRFGKLSFRVPRVAERDLDVYTAHFFPDLAAAKAGATPLDENGVAGFVKRFSEVFRRQRSAPTFYVTPKALDAFAPLYWALRREAVPLRWRVVASGAPLGFARSKAQFLIDAGMR